MPKLLMSASGVALVAATAALCAHGWRSADDRFFAGLISIAFTLSLFSVVAWAATAIAPCLLPGFLSARSLFSSRYDCIESYRSRRRALELIDTGLLQAAWSWPKQRT